MEVYRLRQSRRQVRNRINRANIEVNTLYQGVTFEE